MITIDIDIPEKCGLCPCFHHENPMYCQAVKADKNKKIVSPYGSPRPEWCPLKEQEAVVHPEPSCVMTYITDCCCDLCGVQLIREDIFCRCCGKRIEWEGR